jgi:hypothetical protein
LREDLSGVDAVISVAGTGKHINGVVHSLAALAAEGRYTLDCNVARWAGLLLLES